MDNFKDVGNLTREPELRYSKGDGIPVCTFTIACNTGHTDEADFYDCVAWRKQAENVAKYLKKGSKALVSGRLKISSYDDKDGVKRRKAEINGCTVKLLDSKKDGSDED